MGQWLDTFAPVWAPAQLVFYRQSPELEAQYCQVTSNGLATGTSFQDAAYRATCEVIERDAVLATWLSRRPGRRLDIGGIADPEVSSVLDGLARCGATVELYMLDVGIPVPSVICLAIGDGLSWPGVTVSSAADLSIQVAIRRAVLEQGYSGTYIRRLMLANTELLPQATDEIRTFIDHALYYVPVRRISEFSFLRSDSQDPLNAQDLAEPNDRTLHTLRTTLEVMNDSCRIVLVDVTAPDLLLTPFRVVRALGLGLQQLHCGHGFERIHCKRVLGLLAGQAPNGEPHPLC
jgi:ribosomal protein S12 methylthiotransferase accessory factor